MGHKVVACRLLYFLGVFAVYHSVNMLPRMLNAHTYAKGNNLKYELIPGAMTRQEMQKTTQSVYEKQTVVKEQMEKEEKTSVGKYIVSIFGGLLMLYGVIGAGLCIEEIVRVYYYGRSTSFDVPAAMIMTVCALPVGWILCRRVKIVKRIAGAVLMLEGAFLFVVFAYYGFKHGFSLDELWTPIYLVAIILVGWRMFRRGKK